jgi:hypothetical protein
MHLYLRNSFVQCTHTYIIKSIKNLQLKHKIAKSWQAGLLPKKPDLWTIVYISLYLLGVRWILMMPARPRHTFFITYFSVQFKIQLCGKNYKLALLAGFLQLAAFFLFSLKQIFYQSNMYRHLYYYSLIWRKNEDV